ncbi:DUF4123 domain-containing protein [Bacteroides sp. 224]|uniref:DUF4123 domain-containing protein n=1 Tax=Bacteroides sp. 224 TaxID=2302936 RepID=UPI0013D144C6|nr:DUF4123 domain-containing protein [Bacteroides sp. 224]NDV65231.1 DUF4123 domain-containing protein [Bacteroides sp. 224]
MNTWILPEVKKDIDALRQEELVQKRNAESETFLSKGLSPNYVLIDAALWGTDIDILLLDPTIQYRSLFRGSTGEELWSVAPYLVDISTNEKLVQTIKEKDPIERRVTWLSSSLDIDELRKHLRRFLRMRKEDKSYIYFRFYDPYVVNVVFPNLTAEQSIDFFKVINYIITDDKRINERRFFYISSERKLEIKHQTL